MHGSCEEVFLCEKCRSSQEGEKVVLLFACHQKDNAEKFREMARTCPFLGRKFVHVPCVSMCFHGFSAKHN